jgi:hypothetical protein
MTGGGRDGVPPYCFLSVFLSFLTMSHSSLFQVVTLRSDIKTLMNTTSEQDIYIRSLEEFIVQNGMLNAFAMWAKAPAPEELPMPDDVPPLVAEEPEVPPVVAEEPEVPPVVAEEPEVPPASPSSPEDTIEADAAKEAMLRQIEQILGSPFLPCKHCHGERPLSAFANSLAKHFQNGQLKKIPKTCDKMIAYNTKKNKINNPIYNTKTSIRKCMERVENTDLLAIKDEVVVEKLPVLQTKLQSAIQSKSIVVRTEQLAAEIRAI